jgi:hypothetical protein
MQLNSCMEAGGMKLGAGKPPIHCIGNGDTCGAGIVVRDLFVLVVGKERTRLFDACLAAHVGIHAATLARCKTPDCAQIRPVTTRAQAWTCGSCAASVCTSCGEDSHAGLTCEEQADALARAANLSDFDTQVKRHAANIDDRIVMNRCPRCGAPFDEFTNCLALICEADAHVDKANAAFCALCLQFCFQDAHNHAHACYKYGRTQQEARAQGVFGKEDGSTWRKAQRDRRLDQTHEYLMGLEEEMRDAVIERISDTFRELGIKEKDLRRGLIRR